MENLKRNTPMHNVGLGFAYIYQAEDGKWQISSSWHNTSLLEANEEWVKCEKNARIVKLTCDFPDTYFIAPNIYLKLDENSD